jgi:glycosyltransferase involved in cell wall biosynthesis
VVSGQDVERVERTTQDGYEIIGVPLHRPQGRLETCLSFADHSPERYEIARSILHDVRPDVVHIGAFSWGPFVEVAHEMGIPCVAMVNSYEWLCFNQFLVDHNGRICAGPESVGKCARCVMGSLRARRRLASRVYTALRWTGMPGAMSPSQRRCLDVRRGVEEASAYLQRVRRLIRCFVGQNPFTSAFLQQYGVPPERTAFVPQWLTEAKRRRRMKQSRPADASRVVVGYVGRIGPEKGLGVLACALRTMVHRDRVELRVIAADATGDRLRQRMGRWPDDVRVRLLNNLHDVNDVMAAIAQLDLCVVPSICRETGPRSLMEARAQGVPCVVSDVVGNGYLVQDEKNGRLVPAGDASALSRVLDEIVSEPGILSTWKQHLPDMLDEEGWFEQMIRVHEQAIASGPVSRGAGADGDGHG